MNEPLKGTDCLQKSLDGNLILPDKALFTAVTVLNNVYFGLIPFL